MSACPAVPEPALDESEPVFESAELEEVVTGSLDVPVVAAGTGATATGDDTIPDHEPCLCWGTATALRAKKPMNTREIMLDPKDGMADS